VKVRTLYYLDVRDLTPDQKKIHVAETLENMKKTATEVEEVVVIEILGNSYIEQMFVAENCWEAQSMALDRSAPNISNPK
jgi:hypothetical protein